MLISEHQSKILLLELVPSMAAISLNEIYDHLDQLSNNPNWVDVTVSKQRKIIRDPLSELPMTELVQGEPLPLLTDRLIDNEWFVQLICAIAAAYGLRKIGDRTPPKNPDLPKRLRGYFNGEFWETQIISVSKDRWPYRLLQSPNDSTFLREIENCFGRYFEYSFANERTLDLVLSQHRPASYSPFSGHKPLKGWWKNIKPPSP